jgi:hypothetical protein
VGWWFSGDLLPVKTAEGSLAFVNQSGKVVLSGPFDSLPNIGGFSEGLAPAAMGGKWGYIDKAGKWAIDRQFEEAGSFADGLAVVRVGGRIGYIDRNAKFVVNPQYDGLATEFRDGYARVSSGGKFGFIDTGGHVVVDTKFLSAISFSDGLAPVKTEDGWGFIDGTGKMVVSPQFDSASSFVNGLAYVTAQKKEAYVTTTGAFVVDPFPGTTVKAMKEQSDSASAQRRTMGDLRSIATAIEAYGVDHNRYPPANSLDELSQMVSPIYLREFPKVDGWGHQYRFQVDALGQNYAVASGGKDGTFEKSALFDYSGGPTTSFDADIVFANGVFKQYPEGVQN